MPSGVIRTRMSRKTHPVPRVGNPLSDLSGLRGVEYRSGSVLRDPGDPPSAPTKHRPFATYPQTPAPESAESSLGGEGKKKDHRQAGKSGKTK